MQPITSKYDELKTTMTNKRTQTRNLLTHISRRTYALAILMATVLVGCSQEAEEVIIEPTLLERCIASNSKDIEINYLDKWIAYDFEYQKIYEDGLLDEGITTVGEMYELTKPVNSRFKESLNEFELEIYKKFKNTKLVDTTKVGYEPTYMRVDLTYEEKIESIKNLKAEQIKIELDKAETICNMQGIY